jgi:hypothetical protein
MRTSYGVTATYLHPRQDTLRQVLPRQGIVRQHNVEAFEESNLA